MIQLNNDIRDALLAHDPLVSALGGPRVYYLVAPEESEFPRITFFEITNVNDQYVDDEAFSSEIHYQVDVWAKGNHLEAVREVDRVMKALDFQRTSTADLYEDDVKVFHKALRYKTKRLLGGR